MPRTAVRLAMTAPAAFAPRAIARVAREGSARPSLAV
jgi:hypothetical protein